MLKSKIKIKYFIIICMILSLAGWFFLSPSLKSFNKFSDSSDKNKKIFSKEGVSVKGVEAKNKEEGNEKGIAFGNLLPGEPDAPKKREDFGSFYARAKASIVIDAETGTILHYQNAREERAIASLTKVMTAVIALEEIDNLKEEIVTIDRETVLAEGTKIGCPNSTYCISNRLRVGEKISAWNLFQAAIMNSTNDAALALGKHIAGSEDKFAELMNKKAKELGLNNTHFCNPSGLDEDDNPGGCYSTAYDIARIAAYSLKYDEIWDTMKIKEKDIYSADKQIKHHIVNTNKLLGRMGNLEGTKTGFTYEAGYSLMIGAHHPQDKDIKVVGVLLDDYYRWEDAKKMTKWVFQAYDWPDDSLGNL
jgi:D-alanyl-D-alanine carboxypeptidase (penicillin-binding protein 5/6)